MVFIDLGHIFVIINNEFLWAFFGVYCNETKIFIKENILLWKRFWKF